jgi:hypothetical protein
VNDDPTLKPALRQFWDFQYSDGQILCRAAKNITFCFIEPLFPTGKSFISVVIRMVRDVLNYRIIRVCLQALRKRPSVQRRAVLSLRILPAFVTLIEVSPHVFEIGWN